MNSYTGFMKKLRTVELAESHLDLPITEGLSFFREVECARTFQVMWARGAHTKAQKKLMQEIEKVVPFDEFLEGIFFIVMQFRIVRFLRAISDVRVNLEKQSYPDFVEWAQKKTGLSRKLIFDQTIHFQENPGHATCYSVFGQKLKEWQKKARKRGVLERDFNTYVVSRGFPAQTVFEKELKKKFRL